MTRPGRPERTIGFATSFAGTSQTSPPPSPFLGSVTRVAMGLRARRVRSRLAFQGEETRAGLTKDASPRPSRAEAPSSSSTRVRTVAASPPYRRSASGSPSGSVASPPGSGAVEVPGGSRRILHGDQSWMIVTPFSRKLKLTGGRQRNLVARTQRAPSLFFLHRADASQGLLSAKILGGITPGVGFDIDKGFDIRHIRHMRSAGAKGRSGARRGARRSDARPAIGRCVGPGEVEGVALSLT